MLTERPWKVESVLFLAAGLLISLSTAGFLLMSLQEHFPETTPGDQHFYQFLMNTAGFHGASLLLMHYFLKQHHYPWRTFLGLNDPRRVRSMVLGALIALIALPLALGLNEISVKTITHLYQEPAPQQPMKILQQTQSPGELFCFGLAAIVFAPVVEELLFRGVLFPLLKRLAPSGLAYAVSSLFFAAIHMNLATFVPLLFLGLVLAWLMDWTDNLLAPIVAHSMFNLANFIMVVTGREFMT